MSGYTNPETEEYQNAEWYCPGCGRRYDYRRECSGSPVAPHAPLEVVSTDEIGGDNETAAPDTD